MNIAALVSGGVDSSVTVHLLKEMGYNPTIFYIKIGLEDEPGYVALSDKDLCSFLDGLIVEKRGPHPSGVVPQPLEFLSNNEILKKLRIALNLQSDTMLEVFKQAEFDVSNAELGSFFRRSDHPKFAKCPEQVLRKFIKGLSV